MSRMADSVSSMRVEWGHLDRFWKWWVDTTPPLDSLEHTQSETTTLTTGFPPLPSKLPLPPLCGRPLVLGPGW